MEAIVDIIDETDTFQQKDIEWLKGLLQKACIHENVRDNTELSVTLVDNKGIQEINKQYRGIDKPTDVISFALNDNENTGGEGPRNVPNLLGDIIISVEKASEQAVLYGHTKERELGFLAVHGFLHLLGYTHDDEKEERVMFSRQEMILNEYGLKR